MSETWSWPSISHLSQLVNGTNLWFVMLKKATYTFLRLLGTLIKSPGIKLQHTVQPRMLRKTMAVTISQIMPCVIIVQPIKGQTTTIIPKFNIHTHNQTFFITPTSFTLVKIVC